MDLTIYITIIEDRHSDTEAYPFDTADAAIAFAKKAANKLCRFPEDYEETEVEGWLFHARYSCEEDNVRVVAMKLNGGWENV